MSMLTTQVDDLRERARVLRQGRWCDGADDAAMMDEAANTIESLRARLLDVTMGRATCENKAPEYLDFLCSECGFVHYHSDENDTGDGNEWWFCPECGKAVAR